MRLPKQPLQCPTMATAGNILTLAALLLPPLYMPNGYVGLVGAKFHLLLWLAGIGCALLLCCLQKSLRRNEHPGKAGANCRSAAVAALLKLHSSMAFCGESCRGFVGIAGALQRPYHAVCLYGAVLCSTADRRRDSGCMVRTAVGRSRMRCYAAVRDELLYG